MKSEWKETIFKEPWLGDMPIPNKIKSIDLNQAFKIMAQSGLEIGELNGNVSLRQPSTPEFVQPFWSFGTKINGDLKFILVNLYDGKVHYGNAHI